MQEIRSIAGEREGGGRFFGGGGAADRRLRPQHHQSREALKCPRCDSLNTKFCYYNNYNLSQPRHFCKSCRRYWTDGGVLRNVPIGGGSRKTKRSKPKHKQTTSATDAATATNNLPPQEHQHNQQQRQREQLKSSNSHSSSESSSLTATNTAKASTAVEAASDYNSCNNTKITDNILNGIGESKLFLHADSSLNPSMEAGLQLPEQGSSDCVTFSEIGSFASLIDSSNEQLHFGFSNLLNQQGLDQGQQGHGQDQDQDQLWQHQNQKMGPGMGEANGEEMMKMQDVIGCGGGLIDDQTLQVEHSRFGGLDWQGPGEHGLFDLHTAVDLVYWSSQNQWTDQAHSSLYLP